MQNSANFLEPQVFLFLNRINYSIYYSFTGLTVVGSTYQRVQSPSIEYYIGQGKTKEIARLNSSKLFSFQCRLAFISVKGNVKIEMHLCRFRCGANAVPTEESGARLQSRATQGHQIAVCQSPRQDRFDPGHLRAARQDQGRPAAGARNTNPLYWRLFSKYAHQVQLALLTYRLPRLTNMWSHLERQSAASKGKSNGGVGLRGFDPIVTNLFLYYYLAWSNLS